MFKDKVCIITGGANGIGKALVKSFYDQGASIAFIDKDKEAGERVYHLINGDQEGHYFHPGDISTEEDINAFTDEVVKKYGRVDFLINNACFSNRGLLSNCSYDDFNEILKVGITAPYYLTLRLKDVFNEGASIVNISSTRAGMSQKDTESYSAAKGGITSLTHAMAMSLAGKVRVNSISPGWIDTSNIEEFSLADKLQHPSGRAGTPEDIARVVIFLCDEKSDFINGENITIDGGMSKRMIYHGDENWRFNVEEHD